MCQRELTELLAELSVFDAELSDLSLSLSLRLRTQWMSEKRVGEHICHFGVLAWVLSLLAAETQKPLETWGCAVSKSASLMRLSEQNKAQNSLTFPFSCRQRASSKVSALQSPTRNSGSNANVPMNGGAFAHPALQDKL